MRWALLKTGLRFGEPVRTPQAETSTWYLDPWSPLAAYPTPFVEKTTDAASRVILAEKPQPYQRLAWIPTPRLGTNKSGLLAKDESELLPTQPRDRDGLAVNAGGEQ